MSGRDVKQKIRTKIKINGKYRNIKCSFNNTDMKEIHLTVKKLRKHLHVFTAWLARMSSETSKFSVVKLRQI